MHFLFHSLFKSQSMAIRAVVRALFGVLVAAGAFAGTIAFDPMRGLVEVPVVLNGNVKGVFGIDTGADHLYIDREFARANGLQISNVAPQRDAVGVEGTSKVTMISLRSLEVAGERLYNLKASGIDIASLTGDQRFGNPDGLIGHQVLRRFYVTVDYPNHELTLQTAEPRFLSGKRYSTVEFDKYKHLILVEVTFNDQTTVPMILDYCASFTTLSPKLAEKLGLTTTEREVQRVARVQLGEAVTEDCAVVVADLTQLRRSAPRAEFEGILGATFLFRHKITVDYKRDKVYVQE
jgi:predicted aspartyl protease